MLERAVHHVTEAMPGGLAVEEGARGELMSHGFESERSGVEPLDKEVSPYAEKSQMEQGLVSKLSQAVVVRLLIHDAHQDFR